MNNLPMVPIALLLAYFAALVLLTYKSSRAETAAGYMIGNRSVGTLATVASVAGNLRDGAGLAAWVALGYFYGLGALWLTTGLAAGLLLMAYYAPRVRIDAEKRDYLTVPQLLGMQVGPNTARLSVVIISITALLYAAAQVYVSGRLFASLFGTSMSAGIIITALIVGGYLAVGGYAATILTGIIQWVIIMLIVILPFNLAGGVPDLPLSSIFSTDFLTALGFFGISFLVAFCSADLWQLIFSAASPATARRSFVLSVPVYYLISIGLVFFALAVRAIVGENVSPPEAFFQLFSTAAVSRVLVGVLGVFVLAAVMSTLDSQIFLFTSTIIRAWMPKEISTDNPRMRAVTRSAIIVTVVILALIAVGIGDIIEFLFGAVTLSTVLAPVLLLTLLFRRSFSGRQDMGVAAALIVSSLIYAYMFYAGWFQNITLTLLPSVISAVLCLIFIPLSTIAGGGTEKG